MVPDRKVTKPELGHLQKAGAPAMKHLREFKVRAPFVLSTSTICMDCWYCTGRGSRCTAAAAAAVQPPPLNVTVAAGCGRVLHAVWATLPAASCAWRGLRLNHACVSRLPLFIPSCLQVKDASGFEAGQQLKVEEMFQVGAQWSCSYVVPCACVVGRRGRRCESREGYARSGNG